MATTDQPLAQVTSQTASTMLDNSGKYVPGYLIAFTTRNGAAGTVFMPKATYTADAALAAVKSEAEKLEAVQNATVY